MSETYYQLVTPPEWLLAQAKLLPTLKSHRSEVEPFGLGGEMWYSDTSVSEHTDSQPAGFWTFLWIINNDGEHVLIETTDYETINTELAVGSLVCFDGTYLHETKAKLGAHSKRLAFLAWDMPKDEYSLEKFKQELCTQFGI